MQLPKQNLLDTTPRWLSLTLLSVSAALTVTGVGVMFNLASTFTINPFTLLLHLVWSISVSAWILNIRMKLSPEGRALLAVGVAIAVGSLWSSVQQWTAYLANGTANDIVLVAGAMIMDAAGGAVIYTLYHLNILRK